MKKVKVPLRLLDFRTDVLRVADERPLLHPVLLPRCARDPFFVFLKDLLDLLSAPHYLVDLVVRVPKGLLKALRGLHWVADVRDALEMVVHHRVRLDAVVSDVLRDLDMCHKPLCLRTLDTYPLFLFTDRLYLYGLWDLLDLQHVVSSLN